MTNKKPDLNRQVEKAKDTFKIPCLYCGTLIEIHVSTLEAKGVLNVFCPDKNCEDKYAGTL